MSGLSQQFCVRWNSHLGSLGAAFPQLLAGQRFVDVTLACEGHQVHCHRLVLAACSTYFENLLGENPCKHPIIILPRDIKLWEIQALVDFMYKGEVNVSQAGLPDLLKCAETLKIRGLCGSDASLNLNQITSPNSNSVTPIPAQTETNTSLLHNSSGQNNTNTNPALAKSILSARLSDPKTAKTTNNSQQPPSVPTINPHTTTTAIKHVHQPVILDDGDNSDNGSGNEMCIKTEELIIDEDACKRDDDEDEEIEMEATEKIQTDHQPNTTDQLSNHPASSSSSSLLSILSRGSIRVKSNENLFENYKIADHDQDQNHPFAGSALTSTPIKSSPSSSYNYKTATGPTPAVIPSSLVYNRNSMDIYVKATKADSGIASASEITIEDRNNDSYENIVCSPNFVQDYDDDFSDIQIMTDDSEVYPPPLVPFENEDTTITKINKMRHHPYHHHHHQQHHHPMHRPMGNKMIFNKDSLEKIIANGGQPPVAFVLRNPRGNQPRTYNTDALWAALMDVKAGESIYRASQIHKVPRKTLRNWMKRWDIKSAYPMPRQLKDAAEKKKRIKEMNQELNQGIGPGMMSDLSHEIGQGNGQGMLQDYSQVMNQEMDFTMKQELIPVMNQEDCLIPTTVSNPSAIDVSQITNEETMT